MRGRVEGVHGFTAGQSSIVAHCKSGAVEPRCVRRNLLRSFPPLCTVGGVAVVVDNLHLTDPISDETVQAFPSIVPRIVNGGASAAQAVQVDATHIVLILEFTRPRTRTASPAKSAARGSREHIIPLLARGPERSVGEVIASATATAERAPVRRCRRSGASGLTVQL